MKISPRSLALIGALCAPACGAALTVPADARESAQERMLDPDALASVRVGQRVLLDNFPMNDGSALDLDLERFTVLTPDAKTIIVDEHGVEHEAGDLGVVLLKGTVRGDDDSRVFVSTSPYGVHGFIQTAGTLYAISTGPAGADLARDTGLTIADAALIRGEDRPASVCAVTPDNANLNALAMPMIAPEGYADRRVRATRESEYAIDTDYEYTAYIFGGDANAASAYIQTLIGAVSTIYEHDLDTQLTVTWSRVFSANNDPYPDYAFDPNDPEAPDRLDHLKAEWDANMTGIQRDGVHMLSGTSPGWGGIAFVNALCYNRGNGTGDTEDYDYGVSAHLNGFFPSPLTDHNSGNWDLIVVAHEMGHNHGTGHTHDINWYDPLIDGCGNGDCSDAYGGTIMSYCHGCEPGLSNIVLDFHPRVIDTILFFLDNYAWCVTAPAFECACDINDDGTLNLDDLDAFIDAFLAGNATADQNGDGSINLDDLDAFIACFLAGC